MTLLELNKSCWLLMSQSCVGTRCSDACKKESGCTVPCTFFSVLPKAVNHGPSSSVKLLPLTPSPNPHTAFFVFALTRPSFVSLWIGQTLGNNKRASPTMKHRGCVSFELRSWNCRLYNVALVDFTSFITKSHIMDLSLRRASYDEYCST